MMSSRPSAVLVILLASLLTSGCASFNLNASDMPSQSIAHIPAPANGGKKLHLVAKGGYVGINFGGNTNFASHSLAAFSGSGLFSEVIEGESDTGIMVKVWFGSRKNTGFVSTTTAILAILSAYVIPQHVPKTFFGSAEIYQDGKLLKEIKLQHSGSVTESSLPLAFLFGKPGDSIGRAYGAIIATNTINAMHELNLL